MSQKKRVFLLDAFALIFRGYYALIKNPRINSKGMDTSAILGFMNTLLDLIKREKPDLLAVAFDKGGSHLRTEALPSYKGNRQETPEAIRIAIPYIHKLLKAMNIPIIEKEGFEADDLIGTLAKQAEKEGFYIFMVTSDKDFAQLVSENIVMYRPARMGNGIEIWDVDKVKEKFEIEDPLQVIDFLGMMGDAVDNIPGLPGVGEKTAKKFLKQYGNMENLLANTHELKGKLKEKIEANADLGILSKKLATIILDCPVAFDATDFELTKPNLDEVKSLFQELEFRRMAEQFSRIYKQEKNDEKQSAEATIEISGIANSQLDLFSASSSDTETNLFEQQDITNTNHFYQYVNTPLSRKLLIGKLTQQNRISIAIKTTDINPLKAKLSGISFCFEKEKGYYIPLSDDLSLTQQILATFKPIFENEKLEIITYDSKYIIKVLHQYNIEIKTTYFDNSIAHYLINADMRHDLVVLAENYLNYTPIKIETLIGKGKNLIPFQSIDVANQAEYVTEIADLNLQLSEIFKAELTKNNLKNLYDTIEIPLVKVLASMELEGICLDVPFLNQLSNQLSSDIDKLEEVIYNLAGETFNLASPKQLGIVLFEKLQLVEKPKKTKSGQYATGEEILSKLASENKIVEDILEWRSLQKLRSTYVDALPSLVDEKTHRIHTTYSQTVAATGRLSSINPNLQNIPIRTKRGREIRKAFIPKNNDYVLFDADYSQIELRLIAEMSKEPTMLTSFKNGEDIHKATAAKIFNIPLEQVTKDQRSKAKTVNFGIIYGVSAFGLSQQTDLTRKESAALIENYFTTYPLLKNYISNQIEFAKNHGYVETLLGRRRYLQNIKSHNHIVRAADERNAINAPIQGTAADIIKIAMINIYNLLKKGNYKTKMLLQVHDELLFDLDKDEEAELIPKLKFEMENAYQLTVPLVVDASTGLNWLEAH